MTHALRNQWVHSRKNGTPTRVLSADGLPTPRVLDGPREAGTLAPEPTYPTLRVCRTVWMTPESFGPPVCHWPPPVACLLAPPTSGPSDAFPRRSGQTNTMEARAFDPLDASGIEVVRPAASHDESRVPRECFYELPLRPLPIAPFYRNGGAPRNFVVASKDPADGSTRRKRQKTRKKRRSRRHRELERLLETLTQRDSHARIVPEIHTIPRSEQLLDLKRLLTWQLGGASADGGSLTAGHAPRRPRPVQLEPLIPTEHGRDPSEPLPIPVASPFMRTMVLGIPMRALMDVGLVDTEGSRNNTPLDILNRLCQQLGMGVFLPHTAQRRRRRKRQSPPDDVLPSRELVMAIFFPPLDRDRWDEMVQCEDPTAELDSDAMFKDKRGWIHRVVPAMLLPFVLADPLRPRRACGGEMTEWVTCVKLLAGLQRLANAPPAAVPGPPSRAFTDRHRAAAWHDARLMELTISMAWSTTQSSMASMLYSMAEIGPSLRAVGDLRAELGALRADVRRLEQHQSPPIEGAIVPPQVVDREWTTMRPVSDSEDEA